MRRGWLSKTKAMTTWVYTLWFYQSHSRCLSGSKTENAFTIIANDIKNICHGKMGNTRHITFKVEMKAESLRTVYRAYTVQCISSRLRHADKWKVKEKRKSQKLTYFLKWTFPSIIQVKLKPYKWIEICIDRQRDSMIKWYYRASGLRLFWVTLSFTHSVSFSHSSSFSLVSIDPILLYDSSILSMKSHELQNVWEIKAGGEKHFVCRSICVHFWMFSSNLLSINKEKGAVILTL